MIARSKVVPSRLECDMTYIGCEEAVWWLTTASKDDGIRVRLRELALRGATTEEFIEAVVAGMEPEAASVALHELSELPALTTSTLIQAWIAADRADKEFEVRAAKPERPLDYARHRRVSLAVDMDDVGVVITVRHIANRHAPWYSRPTTN
jgi:hypothetical protein